jgi:hypothetical protein
LKYDVYVPVVGFGEPSLTTLRTVAGLVEVSTKDTVPVNRPTIPGVSTSVIAMGWVGATLSGSAESPTIVSTFVLVASWMLRGRLAEVREA